MIEVIEIIGVIAIYTFFIWPITFVGGIVYAIKNVIRDERPIYNIIISAISLLLIFCGVITIFLWY